MTDDTLTGSDAGYEGYGEPPPELAPDRPQGNLRRTAARGTVINSAFQIGLYGAATLERIGVAAFLTRAEYGMWGILMAAMFSLTWIKSWGIGDKYIQQNERDQEAAFQKAFTLIQQNERDQEAAFQKAFTLELGLSVVFFV